MFIFLKKPLQRTLSLLLIMGSLSVTVATASDVSVDAVPTVEVATEAPDIAEVLPFGDTMKKLADNLAEQYEKTEAEAAKKVAEVKKAQVLGKTTELQNTEIPEADVAKTSAPTEKVSEKKVKTAPKIGYSPVYHNEVKYRGKTVTDAIKNNSSYAGKYKLTFYCPCKKCCGKSNGITASGTKAKEGRTAAILNSNLPMGSKIHIEGFGDFIVEDRGGKKSNTIDIFLSSHSKALKYGVRSANVYLIK